MSAEEVICPTHQRPYLKVTIARLGTSTGQCDECAAEHELERQAKEIFPTRQAEYLRRLHEQSASVQDEITLQIEAQLRAYIEEIRPQFEEALRQQYGQEISAAVEQEMLAEIMEELRTERN